ncbi:MAG: hypothetical protein J5477_02650 [Schwartzia sp.]|nr:hypothetical protein [Schwartzia sp. (in: firmicutes)]MBR5162732.1 hypothetical protein [Schwartzia sp. (in: firmicutes)]
MKAPTKKYERRKLMQDYLRQYSPLEPAQKLGYDVAAISRYAREKNIAISEIPAQELKRFAVP